tara:strand:- start:208 stop:843 length:636 start_codon:yes stop_codon:yes gene_type:complete
MNIQTSFNYHLTENKDKENFFVNNTNKIAYNIIINNSFEQNLILYGESKSGKSHLINIWKKLNNAILFDNNNFDKIINKKNNVAIDDIRSISSEEEFFHIINHCKIFNLKLLVTSAVLISNYNFKLLDLKSRLNSFYSIKINHPDDEMCKIILTKLFHEKQIIIKNNEIFDFILNRINRTYNDLYIFVNEIDKLSLEKKRQLTIPLIKEIL